MMAEQKKLDLRHIYYPGFLKEPILDETDVELRMNKERQQTNNNNGLNMIIDKDENQRTN